MTQDTLTNNGCSYAQWSAGDTESKPVVVFIKDSRDSNNLDSDEDAVANERLHEVVGDIASSFSSARHLSQLISLFPVASSCAWSTISLCELLHM